MAMVTAGGKVSFRFWCCGIGRGWQLPLFIFYSGLLPYVCLQFAYHQFFTYLF